MFEQIKEKLKSMLAEMSTVKTVEGIVYQIDGDELEVGVEVKDAEGNAAADGEYEFEDGTKVTVKEGKITEVVEVETEEELEDEETEETTTTTAPAEEEFEEEETTTTTEAPAEETLEEDLQAQIDGLKAEIEALKDKIAEIASAPAVDPIEEVFRKSNVEDVKDKKLKNILKYAETLKK